MTEATIHLNGGPRHGQTLIIREPASSIRIARPHPSALNPNDTAPQATHQYGTYTRAHRSPTEYEWDGWTT